MNKIVVVHIDSHDSGIMVRMIRDMGVFSEIAYPHSPPEDLGGIVGIIAAGPVAERPKWARDLTAPITAIGRADRGAIENFVLGTCACTPTWNPAERIEGMIEEIRTGAEGMQVLSALSGGVDSTVATVLVHRAVGDRLRCFFIDTGLMRLHEGDQVMGSYRALGLPVERIDAEERFLSALSGVEDPERKRKIIGEIFIRVFEEAAKQRGATALVQGTIYPDIIESGVGGKDIVKSHHNVGGLPEKMGFTRLIEPLKYFYKDEVRKVGAALGLAESFVQRQPFPGPGLAVRIIGPLSKERLDTLRACDALYRGEIESAGLERLPWQYFAVMTGVRAVGVRHGVRTYGEVLALRAIDTIDAMTAICVGLPMPLLQKICRRIVDEVPGIGRVVFDLTDKPPATIEWE